MEKESKPKKKVLLAVAICIGLVLLVSIFIVPDIIKKALSKPQIITTTMLEKIIDVSELSTYQAVYNGVAKVMNEKKPEQIDYYVSYNARIYAGFNLDTLEYKLNEEAKVIEVIIPNIEINNVNVDIASLNYIFMNDKANKSTVSAQAYQACIQDATSEGQNETDILKLAQQNAKNIIVALINPFVTQLDSEYKIEVSFGGNQ